MSHLKTKSKTSNFEMVRPWLVSQAEPSLPEIDPCQGVYIYGAGELGKLALDYCTACDISVLGILDRSRSGFLRSRVGRDYVISSPDSSDEVHNKHAPVVVAIATQAFGPICTQLKKSAWLSIVPFYNMTAYPRKGHPLRNGWMLGKVTERELETVEWLCDQWNDDLSLYHYEAFIAWHRNNKELDNKKFTIDPATRYVIPELITALTARRRQFVDVGSHLGESVGRLSKAGICFDEYVLIEPDESSRLHIRSRQNEIVPKGSKVSIINEVLGDLSHVAAYQEGLGYCSQIWTESKQLRRQIPLDDLELTPDFVKVHTEGSELAILKGARETILREKPCIAFSVYHRREGFYKDIAEPMGLFPGYHWFFRLHSHQGTGAFVYAIPE